MSPPRADRAGDQAEHALGVGVAQYQIGGTDLAQPLVDDVQPFEDAVVREDPVVLHKRVGVADVERAGGGVADVGDDGGAGQPVRLGRECGVLPGRYRLLVEVRRGVLVEDAQAGAVGVSPALFGQAVRRVQQPEGRGARVRPGVQAKESAHGFTP